MGKLELLHTKLDEASKKELDMRLKHEPFLEYQAYFSELCQNFAIDTKLLHATNGARSHLRRQKAR